MCDGATMMGDDDVLVLESSHDGGRRSRRWRVVLCTPVCSVFFKGRYCSLCDRKNVDEFCI